MSNPICSKCGSELKATSRFCPVCGVQTSTHQAAAGLPPPTAANIQVKPFTPVAAKLRPVAVAKDDSLATVDRKVLPEPDIPVSPTLDSREGDSTRSKHNPLVSLGIVLGTLILLIVFINLSGSHVEVDAGDDTPGGKPDRADIAVFSIPDFESWPNPAGEYDEAFNAIRADPYDTLAYYDLGHSYFKDDRFADALLPLEVALGIDPDWYWTNISLANAYFELGEEGKARERMLVLTQIQQDDGYCQSNAAIMMLRFDVDDLAAQCLRQAISVDPENPNHHYNLAITYRRLELGELAEQELVTTMSLTKPGDKLYELAKDLLK